MTVQNMTTIVSFSLTTGLLVSTVVASPFSQIDDPKLPRLTPLAHTNQDDDEKSMIVLIPVDKYLGTSGVGAFELPKETGLFEIAIVATSPILDTGNDSFGTFESGTISSVDIDIFDFGTGFLSPAAPGSGISSNAGSFSAPVVPAPGVLGLLAIAGLSAGRRRRR